MSQESEIVSNLIQALTALLELLISFGKITVAIIRDFLATSWTISAGPSQGQLKTASDGKIRTAQTRSDEKMMVNEDVTQKQDSNEGEGSDVADGQQPDPFWNITTLPTSRYPNIPAEEHAPKYAPDYDTLASLDANLIFPATSQADDKK